MGILDDRKSQAMNLMVITWIAIGTIMSHNMMDVLSGDVEYTETLVVFFIYFFFLTVACACFYYTDHKTSAFNATMIVAHLRAIPVLYGVPLMKINEELFNNVVFLQFFITYHLQCEVYQCYQSKYVKIISILINGFFIGIFETTASIEMSEETLQSYAAIIQEAVAQPNFYRMICCYFITAWVYKVHSDTNTRQILEIGHQMNKN